jgi:hypothetical protein
MIVGRDHVSVVADHKAGAEFQIDGIAGVRGKSDKIFIFDRFYS